MPNIDAIYPYLNQFKKSHRLITNNALGMKYFICEDLQDSIGPSGG